MSAAASSATTVRFDVGGTIFKLAESTVDRFPNALLARMVSQEWNSPSGGNGSDARVGQKRGRTEDSALFIDRDPKLFELVLQVYRNGRVFVPPDIPRALVAAELEYFCLDSGGEVLVTNWNLRDQVEFEKSFEKSTETIVEEIVCASKTGIDRARLRYCEAASEFETARQKAVAASGEVREQILEIIGQAIAILMLSKLKAEKSFLKTIAIAKEELTTEVLSQRLADQSLKGLMDALVDFRRAKLGYAYGESAETLWQPEMKAGRTDFPVFTGMGMQPSTFYYWDIACPTLLTAVNRHLVPMAMQAQVSEDPMSAALQAHPYYGYPNAFVDQGQLGAGFTVTLSEVPGDAQAED